MFFTRDMLTWGLILIVLESVFGWLNQEYLLYVQGFFVLFFSAGYLYFILKADKVHFAGFYIRFPVLAPYLCSIGWIPYFFFSVMSVSLFLVFFGNSYLTALSEALFRVAVFVSGLGLILSPLYQKRYGFGLAERQKIKHFKRGHFILCGLIFMMFISIGIIQYYLMQLFSLFKAIGKIN